MLLVGGDAVDALDAEGVEGVLHPGLRFDDRLDEDRFHHVQLELSGFGSHGDAGIVADHLEADLVGDLGDSSSPSPLTRLFINAATNVPLGGC